MMDRLRSLFDELSAEEMRSLKRGFAKDALTSLQRRIGFNRACWVIKRLYGYDYESAKDVMRRYPLDVIERLGDLVE